MIRKPHFSFLPGRRCPLPSFCEKELAAFFEEARNPPFWPEVEGAFSTEGPDPLLEDVAYVFWSSVIAAINLSLAQEEKAWLLLSVFLRTRRG